MLLILQHRKLRKAFERYRTRLHRIAWSWCHDDALAEDLVQECFLRACEKSEQLQSEDKLYPWLIRIMANLHNDCLRRKKDLVQFSEEDFLSDNAGPMDRAEQQSAIMRVHQAMEKLPEDQRKVISLVDLGGLSYQEVSDALEIPIGTVMSRLSRARKRLKQLLLVREERPALRRVK
ncbi:MAG: RNA polymerase sigma factor [Thiotrichales bacterium]